MDTGDIVKLGKHNDNELSWIVLDVKNDKVLVLSKRILRPVSFGPWASNSYKLSALRAYLKHHFINDYGLNGLEILPVDVTSAYEETEITEDGEDRVFLLSETEVKSYLPYREDRVAFDLEDTNRAWWLRSPEGYIMYTYAVDRDGSLYIENVFDSKIGLRPAFWYKI